LCGALKPERRSFDSSVESVRVSLPQAARLLGHFRYSLDLEASNVHWPFWDVGLCSMTPAHKPSPWHPSSVSRLKALTAASAARSSWPPKYGWSTSKCSLHVENNSNGERLRNSLSRKGSRLVHIMVADASSTSCARTCWLRFGGAYDTGSDVHAFRNEDACGAEKRTIHEAMVSGDASRSHIVARQEILQRLHSDVRGDREQQMVDGPPGGVYPVHRAESAR
jgi:hypothetical protein